MNILILSAGTRNKIVQYFKKELNGTGKVIATDCSNLAPAIYEADKYYITKRITENGYLEDILDICKNENIDTLFTLIDPEISLISKNIEKFKEIVVNPIVSDYDKVEMCFDKYKMYNFLKENNFKTAKSYTDKELFYNDLEENKITFPVFVKPVKGSASLNINKVNSKEELDVIWKQADDLMIQEFMNGQEYGADVYIDMISKEPVLIFVKKKIKMRAGETDKSVSFKDDKLFELIKVFVKKAEFKGIIDIDIFEVNGEYYISEVNPRFGGGYPHAYESGINVPKMIINNINGIENVEQIGKYDEGIYMMKYNEIKIIKREL
ncbi:MAG: ATP-grasp domain-containing protein [Clostridia bacterium]|nr:ATP-grasp domain-containing protein [Clostridia bacterium]